MILLSEVLFKKYIINLSMKFINGFDLSGYFEAALNAIFYTSFLLIH